MKKIRFLPKLGRGGKIVRNLVLAAALALVIWAQYGCPCLPLIWSFAARSGKICCFPPRLC